MYIRIYIYRISSVRYRRGLAVCSLHMFFVRPTKTRILDIYTERSTERRPVAGFMRTEQYVNIVILLGDASAKYAVEKFSDRHWRGVSVRNRFRRLSHRISRFSPEKIGNNPTTSQSRRIFIYSVIISLPQKFSPSLYFIVFVYIISNRFQNNFFQTLRRSELFFRCNRSQVILSDS